MATKNVIKHVRRKKNKKGVGALLNTAGKLTTDDAGGLKYLMAFLLQPSRIRSAIRQQVQLAARIEEEIISRE